MPEPEQCEAGDDAADAGESIPTGGTLPPRAASARARVPCPRDLEPDTLTLLLATRQGLTRGQVREEVERFTAYWHARGALMVDWQAKLRVRLNLRARLLADDAWHEEPTISEMAPANEITQSREEAIRSAAPSPRVATTAEQESRPLGAPSAAADLIAQHAAENVRLHARIVRAERPLAALRVAAEGWIEEPGVSAAHGRLVLDALEEAGFR